mmetsp:Transcript_3281/g.13341  ORF Transcript_3281/g.13341 Transcript_3281/m.13341 type:complete len:284 (+) Transcript_3281:369-1220(+)
MPVQRLSAQARPHVPEGNRLVRGAGGEVVRGGLPAHLVDAVHVPAERQPALGGSQVPQTHAVIQRARRDVVPGLVESRVPHSLRVLRKRNRASLLRKVPNLHGAIARRRREVRTGGVEVHARDPVPVSVAAHDEIPRGNVPHLPRGVVRRRRDDGLSRVKREVGHRHLVPLERLVQVEVLHRAGLGLLLLEHPSLRRHLNPRGGCRLLRGFGRGAASLGRGLDRRSLLLLLLSSALSLLCGFLPGPLSLLRLLLLFLLIDFELLELVRHAIAVYPHQHLLLHR